MAEKEEEEVINYASVVFKTKNHPPPEVKKEDEIVYDEVKTRDKTPEQTGDPNGIQPHKKANSGRHDRHWACCLGILCIFLLSGLIALGVTLTISHKNEMKQLKENQTSLLADKNNLTKLNHNLSSENQKLMRDRNNLTDQFNNLTQACAVLESNITILTSEVTNLTSQVTNLTIQNQQLETQNQEMKEEKKNLTAKVQDLEKIWSQLNISQAQLSVNLYCPITKGERKCNSCLDGWTAKPPNCYAINNAEPAEQRTWESAQARCREIDSDLAVIANEQEKTSVGAALWNGVLNNKFWIGLRAVNGKWKWLNGSELTVNSWIQQPATDGHCALFKKYGEWISAECSDKNQWICQQKALTLT